MDFQDLSKSDGVFRKVFGEYLLEDLFGNKCSQTHFGL